MQSLPKFNSARLLVVGDVMLDETWGGEVKRISPEAPVPVVLCQNQKTHPGGAANVAMNIVALGGGVTLLGVVGHDEAAEVLRQDLEHHHVNTWLFQTAPKTIRKCRIISQHHQMIRLDHEQNLSLSTDGQREAFMQTYEEALKNHDLVILSDYGKGTLTGLHQSLIRLAKQYQVPLLVDPKSQDISVYRGASVVTPNAKEFEGWVGSCSSLTELEAKAQSLMTDCEFEAMVITRSEKGVSVIRAERVTHILAKAREVHDVTGAGDTVIAVMGLGLAVGLSLEEAVSLANEAAGIVVGKVGTASVTPQELQAALATTTDVELGIKTRDALTEAIVAAKARGEKIVFTNGCFDILHAGHIQYLIEAKALGDRLVVAVNTDASVRKLKGPERPVNTLADRMAMLAALKCVDWVVAFDEDTPEALIQTINPDIMVKGGDYSDIQALPGARFVLGQGGQVQILSLKPDCSTTKIIEKMRERVV